MSSILKSVGALAAGLAVGYQLFSSIAGRDTTLRPPGALDEADFLASCIRCGKCSLACPYRVIRFDDAGSNATPNIIPREGPCLLCEDFPCIAACPSGALSPVAGREAVRMGTAVIDRDRCVSLRGIRCEVCYRTCPLIDRAIHIKYSMREGDNIHAIFEPVIVVEACTGCGICVERCVISDPPAIYIRPRGAS